MKGIWKGGGGWVPFSKFYERCMKGVPFYMEAREDEAIEKGYLFCQKGIEKDKGLDLRQSLPGNTCTTELVVESLGASWTAD